MIIINIFLAAMTATWEAYHRDNTTTEMLTKAFIESMNRDTQFEQYDLISEADTNPVDSVLDDAEEKRVINLINQNNKKVSA